MNYLINLDLRLQNKKVRLKVMLIKNNLVECKKTSIELYEPSSCILGVTPGGSPGFL